MTEYQTKLSWPYIICILILFQNHCYSQEQEKRLEVGAFLRLGTSYGINGGQYAPINQQVQTYQYSAGGVGVYGFFRLKRTDSIDRYLQYLKVIKSGFNDYRARLGHFF